MRNFIIQYRGSQKACATELEISRKLDNLQKSGCDMTLVTVVELVPIELVTVPVQQVAFRVEGVS